MSLKDLILMHDAYLLDRWDGPAIVASQVYNLTIVVLRILSKSGAKSRSFEDFHPYRAKEKRGLKINKSNFHLLRQVANLLAMK